MINGKNYIIAIVAMITVKVGGETNTSLTLMHERLNAMLI